MAALARTASRRLLVAAPAVRPLVTAARPVATAVRATWSRSSSSRSSSVATAAALGVAAAAFVWTHEAEESSTLHAAAAAKKPLFSSDEYTVIFVLGGPGAGKGTQCERLVREFGFVHLSAGDLLRAERERPGSEFGELINHYIKEGKIVPMQITINLLKNAMIASPSKNFLIDGFPRALDQGLAFEDEVCKCAFVLFFDCPEQEMEKRLLKRAETSGRVDDNIESIRKRFKTFVDTSMPVVDYYDRQGKVRKVSCLRSIEDVHKDVRAQVERELGRDGKHKK